MNDFEKFMNAPAHSIYPATDINIVREYEWRQDVKSVAKVFDIAQSDVRAVLNKAGIQTRKRKELVKDVLSNIEMSEKNFYHE